MNKKLDSKVAVIIIAIVVVMSLVIVYLVTKPYTTEFIVNDYTSGQPVFLGKIIVDVTVPLDGSSACKVANLSFNTTLRSKNFSCDDWGHSNPTKYFVLDKTSSMTCIRIDEVLRSVDIGPLNLCSSS